MSAFKPGDLVLHLIIEAECILLWKLTDESWHVIWTCTSNPGGANFIRALNRIPVAARARYTEQHMKLVARAG